MNTRKQILMAAFAMVVAPLAARAVSPADWEAPLSAHAALQKAPAQEVAGHDTGARSVPDRRFWLEEAHGLTSWTGIKPGTMNAGEPSGSDSNACAPMSYAPLSSVGGWSGHGCSKAR